MTVTIHQLPSNHFTYLASPYTHEDPQVRADRFELTREAVHKMMRQGVHVFSPIIYTHQFCIDFELPTDALYWEQFNRSMVKACDYVTVLTIEGWDRSLGVTMERQWAREQGKLVILREP